jgi:hypothetical protein
MNLEEEKENVAKKYVQDEEPLALMDSKARNRRRPDCALVEE